VRSQIAIKIYGDDLDTLRGQADLLRGKLAGIPGLADLQIEKQVLAPQIKVRIDYAAAAQYGVPTPQILAMLQGLVEGEKSAQIVEGGRRFRPGHASAGIGAHGGGLGPHPVQHSERQRAPVAHRHHRG
jgi:HME family heavy-metal exporter